VERQSAYHQRVLPAPALIAIGFAIALLVLLPARRLQLAGFRSRAIGAYALFLWVLGFALAVRPMATRFLIPILIVAYLAPFVVAPGRLSRIVQRGRGGRGDPPKPPMKNVTPPDDLIGPE
jgi:hypothetical protein